LPARQRVLVAAAAVLSGAAALVYEVVWTRQLSVFLGITMRAEAVVLAAFMLGLALGSRILGGRADRVRSTLLLFAGLEAAIGVYGVASTKLIPNLAPWYAQFANTQELATVAGDVSRFFVAAAALLIPTFLMGGTIPALVRAILPGDGSNRPDSSPSIGSVIGSIYALNTLGAAIGAFSAGFVLLPGLGTTNTVLVAATVNCVICLAIWLGSREATKNSEAHGEGAPETRHEPTPERLHTNTALAAFTVFGSAALAIQLGWIQALTQILGSSVYAFSLTLAGYLAGLAVGGYSFSTWAKRHRRHFGEWGPWIAAASAVAVILSLVVFERLPGMFLQAFRWNLENRLGWLVAFSFLLVWCLMLIPTALFGFLSPLIASEYSRRRRTAGADVGTAYAANTAGTTLGALLAAYWLLPNVGLQNTLLLGAVGLMACASLLFVARRPQVAWAKTKAGMALLTFAFAAALTPRWDPVLTTSGPFINASRILNLPAGRGFREALRERNRIVFYRESAIGSVSVRDVADDRLLVINGKADGSRSGDRRTQLALGHLPTILNHNPEEVLVVGFGTGMTSAAVLAHPEVKRLDVVEISPEVVEASRFFAAENRGVLFDARLRLHYADARNFLLASRGTWDVIISEPSNPWISGVANLFTREYFELARSRLAPDGLMGQWFQSYGMSSADLRTITSTFSSVFDHVTIWAPQPGDLILVGSDQVHTLEWARAKHLPRLPGVREDMSAAGWTGREDFARMLLLDATAAATFGNGAPVNTDQRPRVEFNAPRNMYRETTLSNLLELVAHAGRSASDASPGTLVPIRDERTNKNSAFGLVALANDLEPELRVQWLVLQPAESTALPTLGVSLRRAAVPAPSNGYSTMPQIEVLSEVEPPDRNRLEERIESLSEGRIASWQEGRIAGGTSTLRGVSNQGRQDVAIAWRCPRSEPPFRTYLATVSRVEVEKFESSLACSE
jgi:spermidine synthase